MACASLQRPPIPAVGVTNGGDDGFLGSSRQYVDRMKFFSMPTPDNPPNAKDQVVKRLAYNTEQTCFMLGGVCPRTLKRLEQRGLIRSSKALGIRLYPASELERFLRETT